MFNKKDIKFLKSKGVDLQQIESQLEKIKEGIHYLKVEKAATVEDGIYKATPDEINEFIELFEEERKHLILSKFVPASGAATRMFKRLTYMKDHYKGSPDEFIQVSAEKDFYSLRNTFDNIESFPFYPELFKKFFRRGLSLDKIMRKNEYDKVARMILNKRGLNYSDTPKALILFHKYPGHARTAFEEHLMEGMMYCLSENKEINLHFTIQEEHLKMFEKRFKQAQKTFLKDQTDLSFNISFSEQLESTDSIAVDENGNLLRDEDKVLKLRPGGHGALLDNLNKLECDIIFIKNIDNVAPDTIKHETVRYKKFIGGYLMYIRARVFAILERIDQNEKPEGEEWKSILHFVKEVCPHTKIPRAKEQAIEKIKQLLNRPIRVCGMVENTSEPGGGPFWVKNQQGDLCLQIVEMNQIDLSDNNQLELFENSTHFNPVDIVCSIRDYKGNKFDLMNYRDDSAGLVVEKTYNGNPITTYELPGLWNGSMSQWLTIFVETPQITFNPVKELNDLLRVQHQTAK
jgi:hypothetical protein